MTQFLLLIFIVLLWRIAKPKRDWYLVETRICTDDKLGVEVFFGHFCGSVARNISMSKDKVMGHCYKNDFKRTGDSEFVHKNGGTVYINQMVFKDSPAAILYYDSIKDNLPYFYASQKTLIWRVVSRYKSRVDVFNAFSPLYDIYLGRMFEPEFTLISAHPDKGWLRHYDE